MSELIYQQAAIELLNRKKTSLKNGRLNTAIRPQNIEDALQIQKEIMAITSQKLVGWKCLLPADDGRIFVGPIIADSLQTGKECCLKGDNNEALIEPEIAFVLGKDIAARQQDYSEREIEEAISSTHMALELIQKRFDENEQPSFYEKLADSLNNQALFLGPAINREDAFKASGFNIQIKQGDTINSIEGTHLNGLPQKPLYWLINYMSKRGVSFKKGQAIITGSYCGVINVKFEQLTQIDYHNLGKFELTFKEHN